MYFYKILEYCQYCIISELSLYVLGRLLIYLFWFFKTRFLYVTALVILELAL